MAPLTQPTEIDFGAMGRIMRRRAEAAHEAGYLDPGEDHELYCACGYRGHPAAVIRHSEWPASECDRDTSICPDCGDA